MRKHFSSSSHFMINFLRTKSFFFWNIIWQLFQNPLRYYVCAVNSNMRRYLAKHCAWNFKFDHYFEITQAIWFIQWFFVYYTFLQIFKWNQNKKPKTQGGYWIVRKYSYHTLFGSISTKKVWSTLTYSASMPKCWWSKNVGQIFLLL